MDRNCEMFVSNAKFLFSFSLFLLNNVTARPPAVDNQEADATSQAVKRRLPREIKLKLAKVARLAVLENATFLILCLLKIYTILYCLLKGFEHCSIKY